MANITTELKEFIHNHIKADTDTNTISVFPLQCGVGKSEYITYLIADALSNKYGLIVVTDAIDRLNNYTCSNKNEMLTEYIKRNTNRISILNAENIYSEINTLPLKQIILMTTQRYFNLSRDDIINLTSQHNYKREKIVVDERIYLLESRKLTIKSLNDISTALNEALDNTVNATDKQWLINQYDEFNFKLQQKLKENENQNNDNQSFKREIYFKSDDLTISEDDKKFDNLIQKYKRRLQKYNPDVFKDLEAINKLMIDGAITSQKVKSKSSNQEYKNYFTVVINNADKLINVGAKVFVLDGTADVSPEYQLKCVNMVDCSRFNRDLSKLTINIVNINTSKNRLTRKGDKTAHLIQTIIDYIKSQPLNIDTIFTYQAIEGKFKDEFENVEHFGNIKGKNDYRDINHICQVGLNRWSELVYILYANEIGIYNDSDNSVIKRIYDRETIDNIRCKLILADLEQNIFRCKIRNYDNKENCTYTLMCCISEETSIFENYQPLVNIIKARYEPLGARVNVINTPIEFQLLKAEQRKTANETSVQKFCKWLNSQPEGRTFKRIDIKSECSMNDSEFKSLRQSGILNNYKTKKQGVYQI